ncbi:unnamed protein product [Amoebophrya sp. A25]|nr:unnamed protein product [Amoebophrya sp. A25]|eukprot:GSA25T00018122001.1
MSAIQTMPSGNCSLSAEGDSPCGGLTSLPCEVLLHVASFLGTGFYLAARTDHDHGDAKQAQRCKRHQRVGLQLRSDLYSLARSNPSLYRDLWLSRMPWIYNSCRNGKISPGVGSCGPWTTRFLRRHLVPQKFPARFGLMRCSDTRKKGSHDHGILGTASKSRDDTDLHLWIEDDTCAGGEQTETETVRGDAEDDLRHEEKFVAEGSIAEISKTFRSIADIHCALHSCSTHQKSGCMGKLWPAVFRYYLRERTKRLARKIKSRLSKVYFSFLSTSRLSLTIQQQARSAGHLKG